MVQRFILEILEKISKQKRNDNSQGYCNNDCRGVGV